MSLIEVVYWLLWGCVAGLFLVLYLRVDWHDWGAVGMTTAICGATVLLSGLIWDHYGGEWFINEANVLWKALVLVGAPVAVAGYLVGMVRDPVPRWQITRRLAALVLTLVLIYVVLDIIIGS